MVPSALSSDLSLSFAILRPSHPTKTLHKTENSHLKKWEIVQWVGYLTLDVANLGSIRAFYMII